MWQRIKIMPCRLQYHNNWHKTDWSTYCHAACLILFHSYKNIILVADKGWKLLAFPWCLNSLWHRPMFCGLMISKGLKKWDLWLYVFWYPWKFDNRDHSPKISKKYLLSIIIVLWGKWIVGLLQIIIHYS